MTSFCSSNLQINLSRTSDIVLLAGTPSGFVSTISDAYTQSVVKYCSHGIFDSSSCGITVLHPGRFLLFEPIFALRFISKLLINIRYLTLQFDNPRFIVFKQPVYAIKNRLDCNHDLIECLPSLELRNECFTSSIMDACPIQMHRTVTWGRRTVIRATLARHLAKRGRGDNRP